MYITSSAVYLLGMKRLLNCLFLAAALAPAMAQEIAAPPVPEGEAAALDAALELALSRDPTYAQRSAETAKAAASLEALTSPSPLTLSASSGQGKLSIPAGDSPRLELEPTVGVELSDPWGTSASLGIDASIDFGDLSESTLRPSLSLSQPLGDFIWGEAPDASLSKLENSLVEAEEAAAERRTALRAELYSGIRDARAAEYSRAQARHARDKAALALERARQTASYLESSSYMAKLRLDLASAEKDLSKAERLEASEKAALEDLVGIPLDPLPLPPDPGALALPDPSEAARSKAAIAARRGREQAVLEFEIEYGEPRKSLAASLAATSASSDAGLGAWDYSGQLSFGEGDLSLSLGAGVVTGRSDGSSVPYISFRADWKPGNAAVEAAGKRAAEAALEARSHSLSKTLADVESQLEDYARQARDLEDAASLAAEQRAYAEALLDEKTRARAAGLVDDAELADARWALDKLDHENDLARCDRAILALKIAAIFPEESTR